MRDASTARLVSEGLRWGTVRHSDLPMSATRPRGSVLAVLAAGLVLAVLPTTAAPPADAFCVILIEGVDDFRTVRVLVDEETTLEERRELFNGTDADGDGFVTPEESYAFRQERTEFWANQTELGLRGVELLVDGQASPALHATTWRQVGHTFHKQDHFQPSTFWDPADFETQEVREVRFDPPMDATVVQIRGGRDLTQPMPSTTSSSTSTTPGVTIEYVVVRAPPGWIVQGIDGYSYEGPFRKEANAAEVDVPAFDTKQPYVLTFRKLPEETGGPTTVTATWTETVERPEGPRGASAVAVATLVGGLVAAVAIRRRL